MPTEKISSSSNDSYDVVIIGAGMAGLYTAFLLRSHHPKINLLVLEQNGRDRLGGRANSELFHGVNIAIGAGIGRYEKDKLLIQLMRRLKIPVNTYTVEHHMAITQNIDVNATVKRLKDAYQKNTVDIQTRPQTFAKFARSVIGETDYTRLINSVGYTDYENQDAHETIYHYSMEDNLDIWKGFSVPWHELGEKIADSVGINKIRFHKKASKIRKMDDTDTIYCVDTESGDTFLAKKVVIATTANQVRELLPQYPMYKNVDGQPFLRVYGKFDKASVDIMKEVVPKFTYVDPPLEKIIPINTEKGVYMIVYNDNANALAFKSHIENTPKNRRFFEKCLERTLRIPEGSLHLTDIRSYFWNYGTHYYKPLDKKMFKTREQYIRKAQRPQENVFVVGEILSRNQGWVEGALESVEEVIREIRSK